MHTTSDRMMRSPLGTYRSVVWKVFFLCVIFYLICTELKADVQWALN